MSSTIERVRPSTSSTDNASMPGTDIRAKVLEALETGSIYPFTEKAARKYKKKVKKKVNKDLSFWAYHEYEWKKNNLTELVRLAAAVDSVLNRYGLEHSFHLVCLRKKHKQTKAPLLMVKVDGEQFYLSVCKELTVKAAKRLGKA